ncbi:FGGY family carbohydrate kinase [Arenibacter sp. GZD96]|uniref:xylulokinase n=1 Tax=Aurantibrevibacter litoralis TaxID=3106030 RepID=UPI002AFF984A|nr:FGGY family carbohydrate kinase [Arenibacter sp. GZD-96]MEA1785545.1 FGGY family carbohydrate kinase [Arenibacter sp. GZD-96]
MYYIGYDIGSSSIKTALVEVSSGRSIAVVSEPKKEMDMLALRNGWAEQHPDDWWKHVCTATQTLIKNHNIDPTDIVGIGISYQMHGLVVVDETGVPLRNAIIWCDSRAVATGQEAVEALGEETCAGKLLNAPGNFTASKLKWVKDNEPEVYAKIDKFMLPGDYIAYKLSGAIATTISGLSEGILWDFSTQSLAKWVLDYYGINEDVVPNLVDTFSIQGHVSEQGAIESGLAQGTPILYRAGDQPNNALSLNVFNPGEIAATGGTSGVVYAITDNMSVKESARVNNFAHVNHGKDHPRIGKLLCINGSGIQYRWLLNNLGVASYDEMNDLAQEIPIGADGVVILPFGNGAERMLHNTELGTRILHLNLNNHHKGHLCRAALEGIAFAFVYGMEIMKSDGIPSGVLRAGNDNLFRSDIFSNTIATLLDAEIEIYNTTGAIGAARACVLHKGDFNTFGEQIMKNDYVQSFKPLAKKEPYLLAYKRWKKELQVLLMSKQ